MTTPPADPPAGDATRSAFTITLSRPVARLLAANALLALTLGALWAIPTPAAAQPAASTGRARGTYTMLAGKPRTGSTSAIYVIDSVNQEAIVLRWNDSKSALEGLGYRNLAKDTLQAPGR